MGDGTYFVGRHELLGWINSTLELNIAKIEQTASGAVACQLMDALFPGHFPLHKVDYNAKTEYDMINNYKVLQAFFTKKGIEKVLQVNKLIKGRPLDNMEFMQWLKAFFDRETGGLGVTEDYDPVGRRQLCKTGDVKDGGAVRMTNNKGPKPPNSSAKPSRAGGAPGVSRRPSGGSISSQKSGAQQGGTTSMEKVEKTEKVDDNNVNTAAEVAARDEEIKELTTQLTELRLQAEECLREREFYYGKLREIEILCQTPKITDIGIVKVIEQILYAANEDQARELVRQTQLEYAGQVYVDAEEPNGQENGH